MKFNFKLRRPFVEAEQFFEDKLPWPRGVSRRVSIHGEDLFLIQCGGDLEEINDGDWVVRGPLGDVKIMTNASFEFTYEPIPEDGS